MTQLKDFALPDVGEGLTEADILKWAVAPGDIVVVNQVLVEIETAKAAVELPSPYAGRITALHVAEGETVEVGRPIITIDTDPAAPTGPAPAGSTATTPSPTASRPAAVPARQPVLVGYGPREAGVPARRTRRGGAPAEPSAPSAQPSFEVRTTTPETAPARPVLAKPPVRKLAKSLGVDLASVPATGPHGTVSRADVEQRSESSRVPGPPVGTSHSGFGSPSSVGRSHSGGAAGALSSLPSDRETRVAIRGVRKHTAAAMVASAFTAPHVTEFVTLDMTATMQLRDRIAARREFRDVKISPLLFVAKAALLAVSRTPELNSTWDDAAGEIVLKHYVNLGIAAATDRGLVVPNIKDADRLDLHGLAAAIAALTETARAGRSTPADLGGGTFTITNIGIFGIDTGTPILNPGEAGILAFGAVRRMPWVTASPDGTETIAPRWVTQLALSFDHRLVDGQQGSQFLAHVAAILTDPALALL